MAGAPTFALLGCGNMGMAVLRGALQHGAINAAETLVVDASPDRRTEATALGVRASESPLDAASVPRLLLAVKPQHFEALAASLREQSPRLSAPRTPGPRKPGPRLAISIMAGWSAASIATALEGAQVVRTMPNLPAQIGLGMTAIAAAPDVPAGDLAFVERLFTGVGRTVRVDESQLDAVTAVSGSGPAYLFLLAEAEIAAAKKLGLDEHTAHALVTQTLLGAATLLARSVQSPAELRTAVTSKGGTTEAALLAFEEARLREIVARALTAARDRGAALGR